MKKYLLIAGLLSLIGNIELQAKDYLIRDFGAKNDGITNNAGAIQYAINFINEQGGGRLIFETGTYVTGSIYLKSNVTLHLNQGATILGSTNPSVFDDVQGIS